MRLMHNLASLNIYRNYSKTLNSQGEVIGKISSGYRINGAKEDNNNLAKSERMRMQIRGLSIASTNAQDGASMLQTAEGGIDNMTSILQRVRELLVKYKNGTNSPEDKQTVQNEVNQLLEGYDDICKSTEFNGKKLLCPEKDSETIIETSVGANVGEVVKIKCQNLSSEKIKDADGKEIELYKLKSISNNSMDVDDAIGKTDRAIEALVKSRSRYGALENRFGSTMDRVVEIRDRMQGAESEIRDVDMAEEALQLAKNNILIESSNAMMVQTNKMPQDILRVLENIRNR